MIKDCCATDESNQSREPLKELFDGLGPDFFGYQARYRICKNLSTVELGLAPKDVIRAAEAIAKADYLLIGAGAGLGVDSGASQRIDL